MDLKTRISDAVKDAMRARDKARLSALRQITSEIKRVEVDERIEPDDTRVLAILDRMLKQRAESERIYLEADRKALADVESFEMSVIREFMPNPLTDAEIGGLVDETIAESGASGMRDMGKVMALLKPKMQGRADMAEVSARVKARLA